MRLHASYNCTLLKDMPEENSVIVIAELSVKDAKLFKKHALDIARLSKAEAGCSRYDVFQASQDKNTFVFIEEYEGQAAFDSHRKMPYMDEFRKIRSELVDKYLGVDELKRTRRR